MSDSIGPLMSAVLYYSCHFLYLGHPSDILARLWVTEDISNANNGTTNGADNSENSLLNDMRAAQVWRAFDDSMRESYKATGIIAGLIAAVISGLFSIDAYRSHAAVRTVLLASLTSSVFSASLCLSLLSTVYMNPLNIRHNWESYGIVYIIILSGPSAWLSLALWTLQAAVLAIVWIGEAVSAKVAVTTLIGIMFILKVVTRIYTLPGNRKLADFCLLMIGRKHGMSHHLVNLNEDSKKKRIEYIMKVYVVSPAELFGGPNLVKQDGDDETRTQIIDDEETFNSNSKSQGSLVQSLAAAGESQMANQFRPPLRRGGSPESFFELPGTASSASGGNQAAARLISVGASFFHPSYRGRNGYPTRSPTAGRSGQGHGSKSKASTLDVHNHESNLKKEEENQDSTVRVGLTPVANSKRTLPVPVRATAMATEPELNTTLLRIPTTDVGA